MRDSTKTRNPCRRLLAVVVPSLLFFCFRVSSQAPHGAGLRGNSSGKQSPFIAPSSLEQHLETERNLSDEKPIIYTFVAPEFQEDSAGTDTNQDLIAAWSQAWSDSGWQPVILNHDYAKRFPHYEQINAVLDGLSFEHSYRVRFWRWLAMAVAGGGWMVDYHTFPLNKFTPELPNKGRLTIHETSQATTGGIPSMMSGSGEEWYRLARTLLENFRTNNRGQKSDVNALLDLQDEDGGSLIEIMTNVISGEDFETCEQTSGKYAVHFSSISSLLDALGESDYSDSGKDIRAKMVSDWISRWRTRCDLQTKV